MASFKAFGRKNGPKRGQGQRNQRRFGRPNLEALEPRRLLTQMGPTVQSSPVPVWTPTDTNLFDAQNGPMANLGVGLVNVYKAFVESGGNTSQLAAEFPTIFFQNGMVGVQLKTNSPDFSEFVSELTDLGVQVVESSSYYGMVDGYAPVSALPTIAQMPLTQSGSVQYAPIAYQCCGGEYQGEAYNEAETSMFADVARTEFNVDGAGITMGVLLTSVNQYQGGLSESYGTGDLNPDDPVVVLQDDPNEPTDEGRAMLENIHDIAPGANLQFATAFIDELSFGANIDALAKAGSQIIVDDVGYADEPMFQSGIVSQAVDTVTAAGVSYFSAAGNEGPDSGYLSQFRASSGNITGIGAGTYMNWNPSGSPNLLLPVTTGINNALITFQYDQPYEFQEPAGSPGVVTSNVNIYVLNAQGQVVVSAADNQNNVAVQQPWQFIQVPTAGQYYVAVQVVSVQSGTHRIRRFQRHQRRRHGQHPIWHRRRHVLSQLVRTCLRRQHDRRWSDALVGADALSGPEPAGIGAIQLVRPDAYGLYRRRRSPGHAAERSKPGDHGPRRRQHLVLRARILPEHHPAAVSRGAGDIDQPRSH